MGESACRFKLTDVFGADLRCGEEAEEGSSGCGGFNGGTSVGFFALDNAYDCGDGHVGFACGFYSGDGRGSGSADIVDDDDGGAFPAEAFDASACAMRFFSFADEESMEQWAAGILLGTPRAGSCDIGDDGISAQGEPAYCFGEDPVVLEKFKDGVAGEATALGVKCGGSAIDVVVAGAARRELELAELEAGAREEREELLGVGGTGGIHQR